MGIGMNFVCTCCRYDTGILMLNQGLNHSIETVIKKYIHAYTQEIDLIMHPNRVENYNRILSVVASSGQSETIYNYYGCVCYGCSKTYEMLDVLQRKQEEVFAGDKALGRVPAHLVMEFLQPSASNWSSLIGDHPKCVFCDEQVLKISDERLEHGIRCPKCLQGELKQGQEFELWE